MDFNAKERIFGSLGAYLVSNFWVAGAIYTFSIRMLREPVGYLVGLHLPLPSGRHGLDVIGILKTKDPEYLLILQVLDPPEIILI